MDGVLFDLPGDRLWEMIGISLATVMVHHLFLRWRYLSRGQMDSPRSEVPGHNPGGEPARQSSGAPSDRPGEEVAS